MPRLPSALILAFLWAGAALAHPEYIWPEPPTLTQAQKGRIASLAARARAELPGLTADNRNILAISLAAELAELGDCRGAERVLEGVVDPALPLSSVAIAASAGPDRKCAERFIAPLASYRGSSGQVDPGNLYVAGALWRRIGEREKGAAAIEQAEAAYAAEEARDPGAAWTCHGGNCISPLWGERLSVLRMYHGTPLHRPEMDWLAALAQSHWTAREADRPGPQIGQRVFDELLFHAVNEGYDSIARAVAENTVFRAASYPAVRMSMLLREGKVPEAMALWPEAGRAHPWPFQPEQIRENPAAFHPLRDRFREWMSWGEAPGPLSILPTAWVEAGDPVRAREALATAVADLEAHKGQWHSDHIARIRTAEALLDSPGDPVARLTASTAGDSLMRDFAFAELAAGLAAAGLEKEARQALRDIPDMRTRHQAIVRLPCRAAARGEGAALMAVRIAAPSLHRLVAPGVEENAFDGYSYQTFLCLFRYRQADAAFAYASAVHDPKQKLALLSEMPLNGGIADELPTRKRFATRALDHIRRYGLWDDYAISSVAADFERLGDYAAVDLILRNVRDQDTRIGIYQALVRSYGRDRIRVTP